MKVPIYNSDTEDFTTTYDLNGDSKPLTYTIHAGEYEYFEKPVADHLAIHLARHLAHKQGWQGSNYEAAYQKHYKEITDIYK